MELFGQAFSDLGGVAIGGTGGLWPVIATTLEVAVFATLLGFVLGVPMGLLMGATRFRGRGMFIALTNTAMAIPPVVIGLLVMMLLSRRGPLGSLGLLYTVDAMVIAQTLISAPIIAGLTAAAVGTVPRRLRLQARSLGASKLQEAVLVLKEAKLGVLAAVASGLGAVIRGVGAVLIVGGNIEGQTRVLTTAIVQESRRGDFAMAIVLCIILMVIAFALNAFMTWYQQSSDRSERA